MNSLWTSRSSSESAATGKPIVDVADTGIPDVGPLQQPNNNRPAVPNAPIRPPLQRNQQSQPPPAVPAPPTQQAPTPAGNVANNPNNLAPQPADSLSLAQLRRIVAEFPRTEPIAYDYVYTDAGPIDEEIDEWFVYQFWQWVRLNAVQRAFEWQWERDFGRKTWNDVDTSARDRFVVDALKGFRSPEASMRSGSIGKILYVVLGRWGDTAGGSPLPSVRENKIKCASTESQLEAMKDGVGLVARLDGIPVVWDALRKAFEPFWSDDHETKPASGQETQDELMNLMTIMYMTIQETLEHPAELAEVHKKLLAINPTLIEFLVQATARLRWDEGSALPQTQVFLVFWKSILLVFGGASEIIETKKAVSETYADDKEKDIITASPLDYHLFRQEVTSKYPAYIPPQSLIPLEEEQTSLLPPLPNHSSRNNGANGILPGPPNSQNGGASILHQPVHIATPAPSPPPSPGVGGKGGKKQNYQTNQNFPFMYPPLDATSNSAGGKGGAGLQDLLVGRKWEGSDIPASILEAGELFSARVRMTRATRQLWEEREKFLKFDRGWEAADQDIVDELDLSSLSLSEKEELGLLKSKAKEDDDVEPEIDFGPLKNPDPRTRQRLEAVEKFYRDSLPQLQSLVIVLLKAIVSLAHNLSPQPGNMPGINPRVNGGAGPGRPPDAPGAVGKAGEPHSPSEDEVDATRSREIAAKAVTGIMILLLKWLKISHIFKFEYFTQLLLDSNYLPIVLKFFNLHDVQQVVETKTDRLENSFFYFCSVKANAANMANVAVTEMEEDSEDEAMPPPIKRRRSPPRPPQPAPQPSQLPDDPNSSNAENSQSQTSTRPEVDELGYPVNPLPKEPITDFSRRNFFSLINYLRIMQKICKNKAHRNLLLMQCKSSNILRKSLKVPQHELRLYTLKLIKGQVPYWSRKWRQNNMRVITAVYLHCRPELRDEWLAGSYVDAEVEEALPLEQALRGLTHWFNVRRYPDRMGAEVSAAMREERDFFVRELERLDFNWADFGSDDSVAGDWGEHDMMGVGMGPVWGG